jgi:regulatory protein
LRAYLRTRDFSPAAVDQATARLRSLRYLNDDNFAKSWAFRRAHDRGYGPRRIAGELRQKGIDPVLVRQVVRETFAELDEVEAAKRLLGKRFTAADLTERKTVRRAAAFLLRHGYSSETVFNLLGYSTDDGNA